MYAQQKCMKFYPCRKCGFPEDHDIPICSPRVGGMSDKKDAKLFDWFDRAMELEADDRSIFLADLATSSPEIALKVNDLIQQYDEKKSFFEQPLVPRFIGTPNQEVEGEHFQGRRLGSGRR